MCFGGGGNSSSNVQTPAYAPEQSHTAVQTSRQEATNTGSDGGLLEGMSPTPAKPNSAPVTQAPGLVTRQLTR